MTLFLAKRKVKIIWSNRLAYAIGLITSDGCLSKNGRHIIFVSKELEMMKNFKKSLGLSNRISTRIRNGEKERRYHSLVFGDIYFYKFLNKIGLYSAKSKTIQRVIIPDRYFADFLRGLFDGDGSFYTYYDKRWPDSFGFKLSFSSASTDFVNWLKKKLTDLYSVKGYLHKGAGVMSLEYVKGDTKKLFEVMYRNKSKLFLKRKYLKLKNALDADKKSGLVFLQKHRLPG